MVADGVTACVPPVAGRVYELPSVPVTVTCVAFVAATVSVAELPAWTEVGLAVMLTVGAEDEPPEPVLEWTSEPHPVTSSKIERLVIAPNGERIRQRIWGTRSFSTGFTFAIRVGKGQSRPGRLPNPVLYRIGKRYCGSRCLFAPA